MPTSTPRTTAGTTDPTSPAPTGARPGNGAARRPGTTGSGGGSGSPRTAGSGGAGTGPGRGSARPTSTGPGTGPGATRPGRRHDRRRPPTAVHRGSGPHHWFAERLLAVLSGRRPVHSLIGHTIGPAYDQLITLAPADPPHEPAYDARRLSPVLHGCGRFTPGPGVIEAFARIATGDRLTALAFRLEQGPDLRWRCAAVELHGPRP
ncbi:Rv3235 family protein [Streptomyces sp. NPDC002082]|uniref:Rv3235 family protein n=1 Tax=Streptomyces sp. NPDC002082 TaxID=3154772 RepID=UPI003323327E